MSIVTRERVIGDVRAQIVTCSCEIDCPGRFVMATIEPEDRWVVLDKIDVSQSDSALLTLVELFGDPEHLYELAHALALVGTSRRVLESYVAAEQQLTALAATPSWMDGIPVEFVEEVRATVGGCEVTKTIAALRMYQGYLTQFGDELVPAASMEALIDNQVKMMLGKWGHPQ